MLNQQLKAFVADHHGHSLSFEDQEFVECYICDETFTLPEGSGVRIEEHLGSDLVFIEVPSGTDTKSFVRYTVDLTEGTVEL